MTCLVGVVAVSEVSDGCVGVGEMWGRGLGGEVEVWRRSGGSAGRV